MLTTKSKVLIGSFSRSANPSVPVSPPHLVPFYIYIFPDPAEKSGAFQLTLRSRDLTYFLELSGPFNVVSESSIPQSYVNSHSHHFRTAPPTVDEYKDDYYSFSALRACAISLGRHDLEELCKLKLDDILQAKYLCALQKNRHVIPEKFPMQSTFQFHVVNITTPLSATSPGSDHVLSPVETRNMIVKEEPTSPPPPPPSLPPPASISTSPDERRRPAPMHLTSTTHKNIGLAILSPGLPPRATADPDSRKQLVEADAIRAQQQALIEERRNHSSKNIPPQPVTPATAAKRTPKTLSTNARSTKRARAPPNITIEASAGRSNPDISIQSAPLYPPRGTLFNKPNGDSGPMTSSLYHKDHHNTYPYSIPQRRGYADSDRPRHEEGFKQPNNFRPSPPRLPSLASQFQSTVPVPPPTPQTPSTATRDRHPSKVARRWLEGKPLMPPKRGKRSHSDNEDISEEDSDSPVTVNLGDTVTLTKREWLAKGHELLERAWVDMVRTQQVRDVKEKLIKEQQQKMEGLQLQGDRMQVDTPTFPQRGIVSPQVERTREQMQATALQEQGSLAR